MMMMMLARGVQRALGGSVVAGARLRLVQRGYAGKASIPATTTTTKDKVLSPADMFGEGAKSGTVPTDLEQATGLERYELLGKIAGVDVFDMQPLKVDRIATVDDPIIVDCFDTYRYVGCTGLDDSHDTLWYTVAKGKVTRCYECGQCFKLNFKGVEGATPAGHH